MSARDLGPPRHDGGSAGRLLVLGFADRALEQAYAEDAVRERGRYLRSAVLLLFVIVVSFAFVDRVVYPEVAFHLLAVRAGVLALMLPVVPVFTGPDARLVRWGQGAIAWLAVVVFGGLAPMGRAIAAVASTDQVLMTVPPLLFALLALFGASGLRFAFATPVALGTVAGFFAVLGPGRAPTDPFWVAGGISAVCGLVVGIVVGASLELHGRRDFLRRRSLDAELARSRALLRNVVPDVVAERLEAGGEPTVERVGRVSVAFATLSGLDTGGVDAVALLDRLVAGLDAVADAHGVVRVKTIGTTVLFVAGAPAPHADPPTALAGAVLAMRDEVVRISLAEGRPLSLRAGVATGPVMAGVIGRARVAWDVWGDTVNLASRLDSHGVTGRIQVCEETARSASGVAVIPRGGVVLKGRGEVRAAFVERP